MKRRLPWIFIVLAGLLVLSPFKPAKKVNGFDLASFGRLPVLHNGRIKPLDTIARNSLLLIRGKQTLVSDEGRLSAIHWLTELAAQPSLADTRKTFLIHDPDVLGVLGKKQDKEKYFAFSDFQDKLGEIRLQARRAQQIETKLRSRFQGAVIQLDSAVALYQRLKNTLRPETTENSSAELDAYAVAVVSGKEAFLAHQAGGKDFFDSEALGRLGLFFRRYSFLAQVAYVKAVPPLTGEVDDDWRNVGTALMEAMRDGKVPPTPRLYGSALGAYATDDAKTFNKSVSDLQALMDSRVSRAARNARHETLFNHVAPFYIGLLLYAFVFLLIFASWLWEPEQMRRSAYWVMCLAFTVHTIGLVARMVLQGRPPVTNLYSSAIFVGWGAVLFAIILERIHKRGFAALAAGITGFCTLIIAHHLSLSGDTMEMMQAVLDSNFWLGTHVITITIGYSSTFLAGLLAIVWIIRRALGKLDAASSKSLMQMTYGVICFSLLLSFIGTMLGGIWADQSWGRFWGWDPKENGALLIVLWHALILHARWGGHIRERGLMVMAVGGNIVCSLSWFGVNMLGIGLHSYGFMDKAFFWLSAFIISQLLIAAIPFLPPRKLRKRPA
jgi:ABC-type transport system involved in cytochrome c biogenesis permease subunit